MAKALSRRSAPFHPKIHRNCEGWVNIDVGLSRSFPIREGHRVQLRFEFFNATNHANFSNPTGNITSADFGRILSAGDPRILQFALKYTF